MILSKKFILLQFRPKLTTLALLNCSEGLLGGFDEGLNSPSTSINLQITSLFVIAEDILLSFTLPNLNI